MDNQSLMFLGDKKRNTEEDKEVYNEFKTIYDPNDSPSSINSSFSTIKSTNTNTSLLEETLTEKNSIISFFSADLTGELSKLSELSEFELNIDNSVINENEDPANNNLFNTMSTISSIKSGNIYDIPETSVKVIEVKQIVEKINEYKKNLTEEIEEKLRSNPQLLYIDRNNNNNNNNNKNVLLSQVIQNRIRSENDNSDSYFQDLKQIFEVSRYFENNNNDSGNNTDFNIVDFKNIIVGTLLIYILQKYNDITKIDAPKSKSKNVDVLFGQTIIRILIKELSPFKKKGNINQEENYSTFIPDLINKLKTLKDSNDPPKLFENLTKNCADILLDIQHSFEKIALERMNTEVKDKEFRFKVDYFDVIPPDKLFEDDETDKTDEKKYEENFTKQFGGITTNLANDEDLNTIFLEFLNEDKNKDPNRSFIDNLNITLQSSNLFNPIKKDVENDDDNNSGDNIVGNPQNDNNKTNLEIQSVQTDDLPLNMVSTSTNMTKFNDNNISDNIADNLFIHDLNNTINSSNLFENSTLSTLDNNNKQEIQSNTSNDLIKQITNPLNIALNTGSSNNKPEIQSNTSDELIQQITNQLNIALNTGSSNNKQEIQSNTSNELIQQITNQLNFALNTGSSNNKQEIQSNFVNQFNQDLKILSKNTDKLMIDQQEFVKDQQQKILDSIQNNKIIANAILEFINKDKNVINKDIASVSAITNTIENKHDSSSAITNTIENKTDPETAPAQVPPTPINIIQQDIHLFLVSSIKNIQSRVDINDKKESEMQTVEIIEKDLYDDQLKKCSVQFVNMKDGFGGKLNCISSGILEKYQQMKVSLKNKQDKIAEEMLKKLETLSSTWNINKKEDFDRKNAVIGQTYFENILKYLKDTIQYDFQSNNPDEIDGYIEKAIENMDTNKKNGGGVADINIVKMNGDIEDITYKDLYDLYIFIQIYKEFKNKNSLEKEYIENIFNFILFLLSNIPVEVKIQTKNNSITNNPGSNSSSSVHTQTNIGNSISSNSDNNNNNNNNNNSSNNNNNNNSSNNSNINSNIKTLIQNGISLEDLKMKIESALNKSNAVTIPYENGTNKFPFEDLKMKIESALNNSNAGTIPNQNGTINFLFEDLKMKIESALNNPNQNFNNGIVKQQVRSFNNKNDNNNNQKKQQILNDYYNENDNLQIYNDSQKKKRLDSLNQKLNKKKTFKEIQYTIYTNQHQENAKNYEKKYGDDHKLENPHFVYWFDNQKQILDKIKKRSIKYENQNKLNF